MSAEFKNPFAAYHPDLLQRVAPAKSSPSVQSAFRGAVPDVEWLEPRRHFAVTVAVVSNVLVITGDSGNNTIHVGQQNLENGDQIEVDTNGDGTEDSSWAISLFTRIAASLGSGNDFFLCGSLEAGTYYTGNEDVERPASVNGDMGNDSIEGTAINTSGDTIDGGYGNDTAYGYTGNDNLNGGEDDDFFRGGEENDTLTGWYGADNLDGELGNDNMDGGGGNDNIRDVLGTDILTGGEGNDVLDALDDFGGDLLNGDAGTDTGFFNDPGDTANSIENPNP